MLPLDSYVHGLDRRSQIKPALQRLHWLPVHFRIIYKIATLMYSILHRRCPQYLLELITFNDGDSGRRCLRSTTSRAAIVQAAHTDTTRPPSFLGLWPHHMEQSNKTLRLTDNYQHFRRLLKTHLFNLAFN